MRSLRARFQDEDVADARDSATATRRGKGHDPSATSEAPAARSEPANQHTIIVKTHDGDGYVLPRLSWEATQAQIEEIYRIRRRETLAEAVRDGKFSILTIDGDIILPSLWDQVVMPSSTVQISLPSEILNPEIDSRYPEQAEIRPVYRSHRSSFARYDDAIDPDVQNVEIIETGSAGIGNSSDESDFESVSSGTEASEASVDAEFSPVLQRQVVTPVDAEGNDLSFQVNTAFVGPMDRADANTNDRPIKRDLQQQLGNAESLGITKAVTVEAEGRTTLQLHVLPGPRNNLSQHETSVRWYHLHSEKLDFNRFKETCLGIPGLSERLHKLLRKLFERIERDKVKVFLNGMFIEPGVVLRADESHQSDPQSVIFSCVPYFDLHAPAKRGNTAGQNTLFASRTLMQSYYPYEPVQERDAEQAYRIFGNEQHNALVHVPNLWVLNIGSDIVATCGHQALSKGFVQSIEVIQTESSLTDKFNGQSTNIRLTDWDGRRLLYNAEECRSYFQMEQKVKELRWCTSRSRDDKSLRLLWRIGNNSVKVTPRMWPGILKQTDTLFTDLSLINESKDGRKDEFTPQLPVTIVQPPDPFFQWAASTETEKPITGGVIPEHVKRSIECLEHVEKAMLSEVLSSHGSYSEVEKTFTSTVYYRALPEQTAERTRVNIESIVPGLTKSAITCPTTHEALVYQQRERIAQKTLELCKVMHKTLALFVDDVDRSTMLRKLWAAFDNICNLARTTCTREPVKLQDDGQSGPREAHSEIRGWFVRPDINETATAEPLQKLKQTFNKCRHCRNTEMYDTSHAASLHLQKHLEYTNSPDANAQDTEQWVISYAQMKLERWNQGVDDILTKALYIAQELFRQAKELSDGVRNEDGLKSDLYKFPRSLLGAFRQLLVFYFAVERALYYTEEEFKNEGDVFQYPEYTSTLPFSPQRLKVLEAFGNGTQRALASARNELCLMVKSTGPVEIFKRLSLSPEYVCSWFMRRLIVKPLEKSMTVSDMYREYLSTIQFQVNHRPGKRLLRSITLLQEELTALQEVNTQQSKLISNYVRVLDDATHQEDVPSRRAMFPFERTLLSSCQDALDLTAQEYRYLLARCSPLSDSTKQSLEINEEDHGKAIMVFTIVTVIFLPLSFVTSFLGMNTTDIRDMGSSSTLFWAIAIPLTAVTMGSVLYIGYNGDDLRDAFSNLYRAVTGKQDRSTSSRGISVIQRKQARKTVADSNTTLDFSSLADEAEFANPQPDNYYHRMLRTTGGPPAGDDTMLAAPPRRQNTLDPPTLQWEPYVGATSANISRYGPGPMLRTQTYGLPAYAPPEIEVPYASVPHRTAARPIARYDTTRPDNEYPEAQTYAEPIVLESRRIRRRYSPSPSSTERYRVPPPQYEWTKKSHRHHRTAREGARRRRGEGRNRWDDDDDDVWYTSGARHVPAPRR